MFVDRIFIGYKIQTEETTYEVIGNYSIRGKYKYITKDLKNGKQVAIDRDDLIQAQKEGSAKIIA